MFSTMKRRTKVAVITVCTALAVTSVSPASAASAQDLENQAFLGRLPLLPCLRLLPSHFLNTWDAPWFDR